MTRGLPTKCVLVGTLSTRCGDRCTLPVSEVSRRCGPAHAARRSVVSDDGELLGREGNGHRPASTPAPSARAENGRHGLWQIQRGPDDRRLMTFAQLEADYRAGTLDGSTLLRKVGTLRWTTLAECQDEG